MGELGTNPSLLLRNSHFFDSDKRLAQAARQIGRVRKDRGKGGEVIRGIQGWNREVTFEEVGGEAGEELGKAGCADCLKNFGLRKGWERGVHDDKG